MNGTAKKKDKKENLIFTVLPFLSPERKETTSVLDAIQYKRMDRKTGAAIDIRDQYQAFLKVKTTDLISMHEADLTRVMSRLTSLARVYHEPFKVIGMTYLSETTEQQAYWRRMALRYRSRMNAVNITEEQLRLLRYRYKLANENLTRVIWVEKNLEEFSFFFIVYGKSEREIEKNIADMIRYGGRELGLKRLSIKESEELIYKLHNMESEL
ncbi:hypothetical protein HWX41_27240 [Bacillus paramycoides]|uniref:hypothetical protein n=1 Tax=Bacillus paramycoides TaxID=2026194 RepID=UPI0015BFFEF6|nr:hypothetical protein [Bacillus paramycoides]NWK72619.1 hypothetical protein [Bacillus paramycoides]